MTWWPYQQMPAPAIAPWPVVQLSHYQGPDPNTFAAVIAPEWMDLDSSNAAMFVSLHGEILRGAAPTEWHKVIILPPLQESEKKMVIAAINKEISDLRLNPYFFSMENGCITFYVNNCGLELTVLCTRHLIVPYRSDWLEMKLRLCYKNFDLSDALKAIVSKRLESEIRYLDLSRLISIPEVEEMLYDRNNISPIMNQLLCIAIEMTPGLVSLSLASNGLVTVKPLWNFLHDDRWKSLRVLDLTDNKIQEISFPFLTKSMLITELHLHGNPLCRKYEKEKYISFFKAALPQLYKLDGTYLTSTVAVPCWKPNFIVNNSCGDSAEFADQFVEHFFTLYDGNDRMNLLGLYHKNAYFSLSCVGIASPTSGIARLSCYGNQSRNLLNHHLQEQARATLTRGSENILKRITALPMTLHDPHSLTVDLLLYSKRLTVLTVTGMFHEFTKVRTAARHFMRTFVLTGLENDAYQVVNDIMYLTNATTRQSGEIYRFLKPPKIVEKSSVQPKLSEIEEKELTEIVEQLTSMTTVSSRTYLQDAKWNVKEALIAFVQQYEKSKIPESAFSNPKK